MTVQQHEMTIGDALEMLERELLVEDKSTYPTPPFQNRRITCPNGWQVSCGFGTMHHCRNYAFTLDWDDVSLQDLLRSPDCEIGIFEPGGFWFIPHHVQIWERVPAPVLLAVVDAVAQYRDGGPCPCPICVSDRMTEKEAPHDGR